MRGVRHMASLALAQLQDVLDGFAHRDLAKAMAVHTHDDEVDRMYTSMFRELVTTMVEDPGTITPGIHLLFCTKNLEQMGDHTTNIAETLQYIIEGHALLNERSGSGDADKLPLAVEC